MQIFWNVQKYVHFVQTINNKFAHNNNNNKNISSSSSSSNTSNHNKHDGVSAQLTWYIYE